MELKLADTPGFGGADAFRGAPLSDDWYVDLVTHADPRGRLTEIYRKSRLDAPPAVQWNFVHSTANAMRGVHVHANHHDYLVVLEGEMVLGLHDIRPRSPSRGASALVRLSGARLSCVLIPPGVAHGFYAPAPYRMVYGLTEEWDGSDEMGCRWDDPALPIDWPSEIVDPSLSHRDVHASSYARMVADLEDALA